VTWATTIKSPEQTCLTGELAGNGNVNQLGYRCEPFSYTFLVKNRNSFPESAIKLPIMEKLAILIWLSLPGQISFPQHRFCRHTVNALYEDVGLETGS
jgi:hypothetical protein